MDEPFERFKKLFAAAQKSEPSNPGAVAMATANAEGRPSVRMVLVRGFDERGFVIYTNLDSPKSQDLQVNPYAALCFHWKSLDRQVRVEGPIELVSELEADNYFGSRDRESRIGAWASKQSAPYTERAELESAFDAYHQQFGDGDIPRPPNWSGYRVIPERMEFWEERPYRLHDRTLYTRSPAGWRIEKLYP